LSKRKITVALLGLFICSMLILVPIQPATQTQKETGTSMFVISSWVSDDGYGQGISAIYMHENATGAWLPFTSPAYILSSDSKIITKNYTANTALRVGPTFTLNHTLHGLANIAEGLNIIRSNVTVYNITGLVFSENNITMVSGGDQTATTYWYYAYSAFDFLIAMGEIYTVTITYEVFY